MESNIININEKHFMGSFRYDKSKPEDFGLKKNSKSEDFIDKNGDLWRHAILWDSGWGNEYGFIKLPEPNFEQLWVLLIESNIEENLLGAAELLTYYPLLVKDKLEQIFSQHETIDHNLTKRLSYLDILNHVMNHSEMKGKKPEEVDADYREWKKLKDDFDRIKTVPNDNHNSFWQRIKAVFKL